ncbi:MAG: bifunctional diaminohydroxyphosphoribosylaminopyrimidine deaminase/5-amino-6-(5-phosphoribosylamino)uracil reductase RibD [Porticoccaceae bacterium]
MTFSAQDHSMMGQALQLAAKARYTSAPNPAVGCVIVANNRVIGEGYTRPAGGNHAEVEALEMAGEAAGSTLYVTLEPCSHQGKTPPCVEAIIKANVARVVVACEDPNPKVSGSGIQQLKDAGIEVQIGLMEAQAIALNKGFFKRFTEGTPWVLVKMAASLDGRTAMASGQSQWITSPAARLDVQRLRAACCAIITGIGTQEMDNPSLTLRITEEDLGVEDSLQQPIRVVVDAQMKMSADARLLQASGLCVVATLDEPKQREKSQALVAAGAEVIFLPAQGQHIDLQALLEVLAQRECNQVMVEAGAGLAGAFIAEGLLDELVCYWAPKLFGSQARPMFDLPIETIDAHLALSVKDMRMVGEDIKLTMQPDKDY